MKYLKLKNYKQKENIYYLWNTEYGKIYPISKELFERNLLNASLEYSYVVTKDDYLIGLLYVKFGMRISISIHMMKIVGLVCFM